MKVYNEIVFDVDGNVTYEDSYEYSGDVMLCKNVTFMDWLNYKNEANADGFISPEEQDMITRMYTAFTTASELDETATTTATESLIGGLVEEANVSEGMVVRQGEIQEAKMSQNPLPSLPSISNVGSVPFTGVVNWNAIPGGFQPLPQTAGGRKKLYQLSQFHGGINQKSSPRDIADFECQEATNLTVSQVGRIKLLGDIKGTDNSITTHAVGTADRCVAGYGLFQFSGAGSPTFTDATCDYDDDPTIEHDDDDGKIQVGMRVTGTGIPDGAYVETVTSDTAFELSAATTGGAVTDGTLTFWSPRDTVITLSGDGDRMDAHIETGRTSHGVQSLTEAAFFDFAGDDNSEVAHVVYAAGKGTYLTDANFNVNADNDRLGNTFVHRKDFSSSDTSLNLVAEGWSNTINGAQGQAIINSPKFDTTATAGSVNLEFDDMPAAGSAISFSATSVTGSCTVHLGVDGDNTGSWSGNYYIYISWLFDGGCETGLTSLVTAGGTVPPMEEERLEFNFSTKEVTTRTYLGADARIEGARIYFRESNSPEAFLLAEVSLEKGIKGALDTSFTPWKEHTSDSFNLDSNMIFDAPPSAYTYATLNGYYADEVYTRSRDTLADGATGPTPLDLDYSTVVVGQQGIVFIGNVKFNGEYKPDAMMFSMPGKPAIFPQYNTFDSPSSDGMPIIALAAFQDTILQFKKDSLYVINVSNPSQFYAEASYRNCGVHNPCQVFTAPFGVIFANKHGCFIYDGSKVISLTNGKLKDSDWDVPRATDAKSQELSALNYQIYSGVPCVGYDPRSQNIIVLKDINNKSTITGAWVYNMVTQSWTEGNEMITNANTNRHTNFIVTSDGYLSILRDNEEDMQNYKQTNNAQKVVFQTKDLDFGLPSQTKKLFKVYITYKGNASNLTATFTTDGSATDLNFTATNWADDSGTTDNEIATLVPATVSEGKDWQSMSLYITSGSNTVATDFEINDIAILYRVRPIK